MILFSTFYFKKGLPIVYNINDLSGLRNRFEEYPKLRELIRLKDELIQARATPPMYLRADLRTFNLQDLKSVFDVILVEPPLDRSWSWEEVIFPCFLWTWFLIISSLDQIEMLEIEKIAAPRSFIWIWCGSGEGLDGARKVGSPFFSILLMLMFHVPFILND